MDYLVEIADHPDIGEAMKRCKHDPPPPVERDGRIRSLYADSNYAASVWQQLRYCSDYRSRIAEEILLLLEERPYLSIFGEARLLRLPGRIGPFFQAMQNYDTANPGQPKLTDLAMAFLRDSAGARKDFEERLKKALLESTPLVDGIMSAAHERPFVPALLNDIAVEERRREARAMKVGFQSLPQDLYAKYSGAGLVSIEDRVENLIRDRGRTRRLAEEYQLAVPFSFVHERELEEIRSQRDVRLGPLNGPAAPLNRPPQQQAMDMNLAGLAFSGGGIRSATFNLGVMQSLASLGLLKHFDYLSTVSGGGYIGGWFGAWLKRLSESQTPAAAVDDINSRLSPLSSPNPFENRVRPIRWLREYSNYLTPEKGFFSADTWTMIAIYVRNAVLNLTILFLCFAAVLLLPLGIHGYIERLFQLPALWILPAAIGVAMLPAAKWMGDSLRLLDPEKSRLCGTQGATAEPRDATARQRSKELQARYAGQLSVQLRIVIPMFITATIASAWLWVLLHPDNFPTWAQPVARAAAAPARRGPGLAWAAVVLAAVLYEGWLLKNGKHREWVAQLSGFGVAAIVYVLAVRALPTLVSLLLAFEQFGRLVQVSLIGGGAMALLLFLTETRGYFFRCFPSKNKAAATIVLGMCTLFAGVVGAASTWAVGKLFERWNDPDSGLWHAIAFGPPLILTVLAAAVVFQLGVLGSRYPDERREWWGRMRAWVIIYSIAWMAAFAFAIYVPALWVSLTGWVRSAGGMGAGLVWAGSTYLGLRKSRTVQVNVKDERKKPKKSFLTTFAITVTPYIFVVGFVALVSLTIYWTLDANFIPRSAASGYWSAIAHAPDAPWTITAALVLLGLSVLLSWRVGVNEFSMHHFYKNRLVRCYLGASRWHQRKADLFTGFDPDDDLPLSSFRGAAPAGSNGMSYSGPYPVVNAAVNLVKGDDLAWQERKATSFVFTPAYCGFDVDRAVLNKRGEETHDDGYRPTRNFSNDQCGIRLGTAIAISGAAASSNMGRITTPAFSFLMTVFNVRLGWWLGNPRRRGDYWKKPGPTFGLAYALVELLGLTNDRRGFINLSDGGHFENLGIYELIRRGCRFIVASDAGQDGSFALEDLGNVIRKCRTDFAVDIDMRLDCVRSLDARKWSKAHCAVGEIRYPNNERGVLVYLKPTISGDEPFDILEYYNRVPEFPHETTADQWFNESQFESYRQLGSHIAQAAFGRFCTDPEQVNPNKDFFDGLRRFWYPPSEVMTGQTSNLTNDYIAIMDRVRSLPALQFLDRALFPSWPNSPDPMAEAISPQNRRDAYYICNALIQLMENVYFDLDLETNHGHPHVEGWMSIFQYWAKQSVFCETWAGVRDTYATRFQNFYDDRVAPKSARAQV